MSDRTREILMWLGAVALIFILATIVVTLGPHSKNVKVLSGNSAVIQHRGELVLATLNEKQKWTFTREGDDIVVTPNLGVSWRVPLCGLGCMTQTTVGLFNKITFTEQDDNQVRVDWPFGIKQR